VTDVKQIFVSTATLPMAVGKAFYDYEGIFEAFDKLDVEGVELVFLPEWDHRRPPVTPTSADWGVTPKVRPSEIADLCISRVLSVPLVHVNRDVGTMLSSAGEKDLLRGQEMLSENLAAASALGSKLAVLHLWDTYGETVDIQTLFGRVHEVSSSYQARLAIENIPISDTNLTTPEAWKQLEEIMPPEYGFTLDLNWCSLYDGFDELSAHLDRVLNVHVQGAVSRTVEGTVSIVPRVGRLDILGSLAEFCGMGYDAPIVLELNRPKGVGDFEAALRMIAVSVGRAGIRG